MKSIPYPLRGEWLITPDGADLVLGVWETAHTTGRAERIALALEARDGKPFQNERNCAVSDGVAVMNIDGPLMRKAELFSDISGATSYQWIGATADALRADPSVKKVVIKFNSPGGEAAGCGECGEKIARLRDDKHVEAYVETQAASAAWWLATQCSKITAHPTAQVGWIGAVRTLIDDSERDEKNGIRRKELVSKGAEKKRTLPMDAAVVARGQRGVDEFGRLFTEAVAAGRGVSTEHVLENYGGGEGMFAEAALDVGMIDAIGDFESTLASLRPQATNQQFRVYAAHNIKGALMAKNDVRTADADNEWKCGGCSEMMGPSASKFCSKCAADDDEDGDEDEAKALGLDTKAKADVRRARMIALVDFERGVIAQTGADSAAAALGKVSAGTHALAELEKAQKAAKLDKETALQQQFKTALADKRLSLGLLTTVIPTFLSSAPGPDNTPSERQKAETAIAALPAQTREGLVAALSTARVSADALTSITAFASVLLPATSEAPHVEPPLDDKNRKHIVNVSKEEAAKYGMTPESFAKFSNITSVDQLEKPAQKTGA